MFFLRNRVMVIIPYVRLPGNAVLQLAVSKGARERQNSTHPPAFCNKTAFFSIFVCLFVCLFVFLFCFVCHKKKSCWPFLPRNNVCARGPHHTTHTNLMALASAGISGLWSSDSWTGLPALHNTALESPF